MISSKMPKTINILLVEDSQSDANLTIREFKKSKIPNTLHWVEDGESAIAYLRKQDEYANAASCDLILLDLNLPGMDGQEVLAEVKSDPDLKQIPVVVLTTSADEHDVLTSYNLNANCYLTKPVDIQQFLHIVRMIDSFWLAAVRLPPD